MKNIIIYSLATLCVSITSMFLYLELYSIRNHTSQKYKWEYLEIGQYEIVQIGDSTKAVYVSAPQNGYDLYRYYDSNNEKIYVSVFPSDSLIVLLKMSSYEYTYPIHRKHFDE